MQQRRTHFMRARWARSVLVFALGAASLAAQAETWTLRQALDAAWKQDATLRAARAGALSAREKLPQARAQLLPNVGFNASRNHNDLNRTQPGANGAPVTTDLQYQSYNQTLQLRQPLYRKPLWAGLEQARHTVAAADAALGKEERGLAERVLTAYLEALLSEEQLALVQAQRKFIGTALAAAQKALVAGTGTRTDIDEAQAKLDLNAAQLLEAEQSRAMSRRQLSILVNAEVSALSGLNLNQFNPESLTPETLDHWLALAESNNPEMLSLRAQRDAVRLEIDKAQAGHHPTLDALIQWTRSGNESVTSNTSSYTNRAVGLQLNLPLYGGGYQSSVVRQAVADLERSEEGLEARRRTLSVDVHNRYRGVTEGRLQIKAMDQAVRSAQQLVLSSQRSQEAGVRTALDVLKAEQNLQQTRLELAKARFVYAVYLVGLRVLAGVPQEQLMADVVGWFE